MMLDAMPQALCTLHIKVNRTDVRLVEVLVADHVHASVVFDVLPNTHAFELPEGRHTLSIRKLDGTQETRSFNLNTDQTITL